MDMILEEADKDNTTKESLVLPENQELYDKLGENLYIPSYTDGIIERGFGAFCCMTYATARTSTRSWHSMKRVIRNSWTTRISFWKNKVCLLEENR